MPSTRSLQQGAKQPSEHVAPLIALNAHRYHDGKHIVIASQSVAVAVAKLRAERPTLRALPVLFLERDGILDAEQTARIGDMGIEIRPCPGASNGERLNRQIETAIAEGFGLFLRIDADDAITPDRLLHQIALFETGEHDIVGAGLSYRHEGSGRCFAVIPPAAPGAMDYILNRYVLHQTMGIRTKVLAETGLRYWNRRLEDKEILLRARLAGLRIHNAPEIWGDYLVSQQARNTPEMARLAYDLTRSFLVQTGRRDLIPLAWCVYAGRRLVPVSWLRRLRSVLTRDASRMIAAE